MLSSYEETAILNSNDEIEHSSQNNKSTINAISIHVFSNLITIVVIIFIGFSFLGSSLIVPIKEKYYLINNSRELQKAALIAITDSPIFYLELSKFFEERNSYEKSKFFAELGLDLLASNAETKTKLLHQINTSSSK